VQALGKAVRDGLKLRVLNLRANCIMSEGALKLASLLAGAPRTRPRPHLPPRPRRSRSPVSAAGNKYLRSLDLDDNGIGPPAPRGLLTASAQARTPAPQRPCAQHQTAVAAAGARTACAARARTRRLR
jgi:hypothetical protein